MVEDRIGPPQNQDNIDRAEINNVNNNPPNLTNIPPNVSVGRDSQELTHELARELVPLIRELIERPEASGDAEVGAVQTSDLVHVPNTRELVHENVGTTGSVSVSHTTTGNAVKSGRGRGKVTPEQLPQGRERRKLLEDVCSQ